KNSPLGMSTLIPATAATSPKRLTRSTRETSPAINPPYQSSDVEGRHVADHALARSALAAGEDAVAGVAEDDRREGDQREDRRDRVGGRQRRGPGGGVDRHRDGRRVAAAREPVGDHEVVDRDRE